MLLPRLQPLLQRPRLTPPPQLPRPLKMPPLPQRLLLKRNRFDMHYFFRHSRERGNPDFAQSNMLKVWIPAFAGMTDVRILL